MQPLHNKFTIELAAFIFNVFVMGFGCQQSFANCYGDTDIMRESFDSSPSHSFKFGELLIGQVSLHVPCYIPALHDLPHCKEMALSIALCASIICVGALNVFMYTWLEICFR